MTETEWVTATDPIPMLEFLLGKASDRKLRLVAIAHAHQAWGDYKIEETEAAWKTVEVAERYSDGLASGEQLQAAHQVVLANRESDDLAIYFLNIYAGVASAVMVENAYTVAMQSDYAARTAPNAQTIINADRLERCGLLRDIFSNPFRPVAFDPEWRTSTAVAVAQGMYESRDFSAMPILADALQDAGCDNDNILNHCRDANGVHVRGCWVVDLVLSKE